MKKLKYLLGISLFIPALSFVPVLAAQGATSGSGGSTTPATTPSTNKTESTSPSTVPPKPSDPGIKEPDTTDSTARNKRLDSLKTQEKISLGDADKKRIIQKCKPAQGVVEKTETSDKDNGVKTGDAYKNIVDRITALITKLQTAGQDVTKLQADLTTLQQEVATFNTDLNTYRQTVTDLRALDCASDPAAFQAALTAARTQRDKVRADAQDIRTYITGTVKVDLQAVKTKLEAEKTDATTPTTDAANKTTTTNTTTTGGKQ